MKLILAAETAEQVIIQQQLLMHIERATAPPDFGCPEDRWLRNAVALPDLQHTPVAFECARMLDAQKGIVLIDEATAPHHNVTTAGRVDLLCDTLQRTRHECIIGIEE